jgi:hypothetical protein
MLCKQQNTTIWFRWTRRNHRGIQLADRLSKTAMKYDWTFNQDIRDKIIEYTGLPHPTIDVFADAKNKTTQRYMSQNWDGDSQAVNFFDQQFWDWHNEIIWANPPFAVRTLMRTVEFVIANHIQGWVVMPIWSRQPFWKITRKKAAIIIHIPRTDTIFIPPSHNKPKELKKCRWM